MSKSMSLRQSLSLSLRLSLGLGLLLSLSSHLVRSVEREHTGAEVRLLAYIQTEADCESFHGECVFQVAKLVLNNVM